MKGRRERTAPGEGRPLIRLFDFAQGHLLPASQGEGADGYARASAAWSRLHLAVVELTHTTCDLFGPCGFNVCVRLAFEALQ